MKKIFKRIKQFSRHPLTRRYPLGAIFRYVTFHLQHKIMPKPRVYNFVEGVKFVAEKGMAGIVGNIYTGLHEFEDMAFLLHYLREGDDFLDIGANVGAFSLLGGAKGAHCYAIEPVPTTFKQLVRNIKLNELESLVKCFQLGFSDSEGILEFSQDKGTMNRVVNGVQSSILVSVQTVDQFIIKQNITPKMMKIDVEGFEFPVLKGGLNLFLDQNCEVIIIELNGSGRKYGFRDEEVHEFLISSKFQPVIYHPFQRTIEKLSTYRQDTFNTIYVKNVDQVQRRLRQAPRIKVLNQFI